MGEEKKYTIKEIKDFLKKIMSTYVAGEDNSWRCEHNLDVILRSLDDFIYLDKI